MIVFQSHPFFCSWGCVCCCLQFGVETTKLLRGVSLFYFSTSPCLLRKISEHVKDLALGVSGGVNDLFIFHPNLKGLPKFLQITPIQPGFNNRWMILCKYFQLLFNVPHINTPHQKRVHRAKTNMTMEKKTTI